MKNAVDLKGINEERKVARDMKTLHSQFEKGSEESRVKVRWNWLNRSVLKKETECTKIATGDQAISRNNTRNHFYEEEISKRCRISKEFDETLANIVSEC